MRMIQERALHSIGNHIWPVVNSAKHVGLGFRGGWHAFGTPKACELWKTCFRRSAESMAPGHRPPEIALLCERGLGLRLERIFKADRARRVVARIFLDLPKAEGVVEGNR